MSQKYFFIFSIGPVQSFIAQARKAQDLYLGCRMISDYCRYAAMVFQKQDGTVIFPELKSDSLTNRFMGTIDLTDESKGVEIAKYVEASVKNRFVQEGLMAISAGLNDYDVVQIRGVKEQLENHLETYWAFSLYDEHNYDRSYSRAEQVFGMSKYMRTPGQLAYQSNLEGKPYQYFGEDFLGETGRKCSVDGELNVKIYRWSEGDRNNKYHKTAKGLIANKLFQTREEVMLIGKSGEKESDVTDVLLKFIQEGEGLSAVSFFKRCYVPDNIPAIKSDDLEHWQSKYSTNDSQPPFSSTALVAISDCIEHLEDKKIWQDLKTQLDKAPEDEFVFEENCTAAVFKKYDISKAFADKITAAQKAFQNSLKKQGADLHSYYALVAIDIDSLGTYLRKQKKPDDHQKLAQKLHEFAKEVGEITSNNLGCTLHAGGDDFLLMLNMQHLFSILQSIEDKWKSSDINLPLSYSTAIVISHYKAPLTHAVKTVKAELQNVKNRFENNGKNGAACCFMAKSGAVTTSYFKQDKLSLLSCLFHALQKGDYSPKFIFQFAKNMEEMGFHGETTQVEQEEIRKFSVWELQGLMIRARDSAVVPKEGTQKFAMQFESLIQEQLLENSTELDLNNFLQFLKMAELAAKHTNVWP